MRRESLSAGGRREEVPVPVRGPAEVRCAGLLRRVVRLPSVGFAMLAARGALSVARGTLPVARA